MLISLVAYFVNKQGVNLKTILIIGVENMYTDGSGITRSDVIWLYYFNICTIVHQTTTPSVIFLWKSYRLGKT